jgi:hypothetical protein
MSNSPNTPPPNSRRVPFEALLPVDDPQLLEGLDLWVRLGWISDQQVKRWARQHLRSNLSESPIAPLPLPAEPNPRQGVFITPVANPNPNRARPDRGRPDRTRPNRDRSLISRVLSSFMAEISVVWLLFLGVFLVVVSSAVLAATQWQNFNTIGQYGILFGYTIAFGISALWAKNQDSLRLTSRMLAATTLLIVPVNFWMMDGFGLFRSGLGWIVGIIAAIALMGMQWRLLEHDDEQASTALVANLVGLSALQWGWAIPGIPIVATYAGTIGTAIVQIRSTASPLIQSVAAFGTLLLIARSTLAAGVPLSMLGMAIGICGALLCWESRDRDHQSGVWLPIGMLLLVTGWFVAVVDGNLWQGLGVSVLALGLLWERLHRLWENTVVVGFIGVGLQAYTLMRVMVPATVRSSVMDWITQAANVGLGAWELTGLGFFVSLVGIAGFAEYLRRREQPDLAKIAQTVGLWFGIALAFPGLFNPAVRSIYFFGTFLLLFASRILKSQPTDLTLREAYLIHGVGILALLSGLEWRLGEVLGRSQAGLMGWTIAFLICALLEWGLLLVSRSRAVKHSAWTLGLGFAGLLYGGLLYETFDNGLSIDRWMFQEPSKGLYLGLVLPAVLTIGARLRGRMMEQFPVTPKIISTWSVVGLSVHMLLALHGVHMLLVSGAIATALMILNTKVIRSQWATAIVVTIGLLFTYAVTRKLTKLGFLYYPWSGYIVLGLWILQALFCARMQSEIQSDRREHRPERSLSWLYANALDGWAIVIVSLTFMVAGLTEFFVWTDVSTLPEFMTQVERIPEVVLMMVGIVFRTRDRRYGNWGLLGLTIAIEWLVAYSLTRLGFFFETPNTALAIANVSLMFGTQIVGDLWLNRFNSPALIRSRIDRPSIRDCAMVHISPLMFGTIAFLITHRMFVQWGGLYTILVALVVVLIARRDATLKLLTYLGVFGVTMGIYELVFFKLMQNPLPSMVGDTFVVLTLVGAVLAWGYRLLHRPIRKLLRLEDAQVMAIGHLHFAVATGLGSLALLALIPGGLSQTMANLLAGLYGLLGCYALSLGRSQATWLTIGILQLWVGIAIFLLDWLPQEVVWSWGGAIAALIAYVTAAIPWQRIGYTNITPIRNCAIGLPGAILVITLFSANIPSLLLAGGFYAWLATVSDRFRLSYVSVGLGIWAAWRLCGLWGLTDPLWYVSVVSVGIVFIVESDPDLQGDHRRESRHWMRMLAVGLVALTALVQSELSWSQGLLTIALSLVMIAFGLVLKTRAYLYVGTIVFLLKVLRQLWVFIGNYSLLLWALGITLGLLLIWIAATFEARRSRAIAFVQYWIGELDRWE